MLSRPKPSAHRRLHHVPVAVLTLSLLLLFAGGALAAPSGKGGGGGKAKPTISIASPSAGSTASGSVTVSGSASGNSTSLASVQVSVDGGAYRSASGTTSWNFPLDTASYADGTHTLAAKATDSRGNTAVTTETLTFSNSTTTTPPPPPPDTTPPSVSIAAPAPSSTVSGTVSVAGTASDNTGVATVQVSVDNGAYQTAQGASSWSYPVDTTALADGSHTLTARATDTSGNVSTSSESVTVQNSTSLPSGVVDQLVTPEGATIQIYSGVTGWTAQQVYDLLKPNAYQLGLLGPTLTIKVQSQYASQTTTGASSVGDPPVYSNFSATIYLKASNSSFASAPDAVLAHEYGCAWTQYHLWIDHAGDWDPYLSERNLLGNPLLDSNLNWSRTELIADDYRMLFGTQKAQDELSYINPYIPDPRTVSGLKDWFVNSWA